MKDLYWFQSLLLDVALFMFAVLALFVVIVYKIFASISGCFFGRKSPKIKTQ